MLQVLTDRFKRKQFLRKLFFKVQFLLLVRFSRPFYALYARDHIAIDHPQKLEGILQKLLRFSPGWIRGHYSLGILSAFLYQQSEVLERGHYRGQFNSCRNIIEKYGSTDQKTFLQAVHLFLSKDFAGVIRVLEKYRKFYQSSTSPSIYVSECLLSASHIISDSDTSLLVLRGIPQGVRSYHVLEVEGLLLANNRAQS